MEAGIPEVQDSERELVLTALAAGCLGPAGITLYLADIRASTLKRAQLVIDDLVASGKVYEALPHIRGNAIYKVAGLEPASADASLKTG